MGLISATISITSAVTVAKSMFWMVNGVETMHYSLTTSLHSMEWMLFIVCLSFIGHMQSYAN